MKNITKLLLIIGILLLLLVNYTPIYASGDVEWWSKAVDFFNGTDWQEKRDQTILSDLKNIIKMLGNAIFIIVTVVLGIKYMLSSAEGKGDVKEGLTSLLVAIVFFYGWTALDEILGGLDGRKDYSFEYWFSTASPQETILKIFNIAVSFLNVIAVGVLLYVGVKYLFSGAEGKADLKGKGVPFIVGLVMTFATISFLNFLIKVVDEIIA